MVFSWVHRDDHELEEMEAARRPGRPPASKYLLLKNRIEKELDEFKTGYRVPDLTNMENVKYLQAWDGQLGGLSQVTFIHVTEQPLSTEKVAEEDKMEA